MAAPKSLAVIVSCGTTNQFVQALTVLMAAVHSDIAVRVLFRDEAVLRLRREAMNEPRLSAGFHGQDAPVMERLRRLDLADVYKLFRDIKASGDVKYYACSSSLAVAGLTRAELIPEIDDVRGLPAFLLEDIAWADRTLTF